MFGTREGVNVARLIGFIINHGTAEMLYRTARGLPHLDVNLRRIERAICGKSDFKIMRMFAMNIPGINRERLERLAFCAEVLSM